MSCNWPIVQLGKYCTKIGSGATPRGGSSVYLDKGEVTLIRSQNIYNDRFKAEGLVYITEAAALKLKNVIIEPNDVLINITGDSVARVCLAPEEYLPARVNQHVAILRVDPKEFDHRYLRYFLTSQKVQNHLLTIASTGGTRNALTKIMLESLDVIKPPLGIQKEIGSILEKFENKIRLNTETNQTLEKMAQAIFKSWFVDFDPVKAKIRGEKTVGMDAATTALFPDKLVASELGLIPEGFEIKPLDTIADFQNGLALQKFRPESDEDDFLPVLKIAQLRQGYCDGKEKARTDIKESCRVYDGDVIFSWSGSLMVDLWTGGNAALNQHLFKVTSKEYSLPMYLYWTKHHLASFQQIAKDKAVTMGHIKRSHLSESMCLIPSKALQNRFDEILHPLIKQSINLRLQSNKLSKLRDTLLPKLLSGDRELGIQTDAI